MNNNEKARCEKLQIDKFVLGLHRTKYKKLSVINPNEFLYHEH